MLEAPQSVVLSRGQLRRGGIILGVIAGAVLIIGFAVRVFDRHDLAQRTTAQATATVAVVHPQQDAPGRTLTLPGAVQAWQLAPVYARTNGYLKRWYVDIGTRVKEGQVLAEIDAPELDQQLAAAQANLATADANRQLAVTTADRWQKLVDKDAVSRQEADEKKGELAARIAMTSAARAEVDRLHALEGFKRIVAPFDGIVTTRSTDVGALINANGTAQPLFTVADIRKMRIYVRVPQSYSTSLRTGMTAELSLPEYPDRTFSAKLARTSESVNDQSGTVLTQLEADNTDGLLKSGAYADVNFTLTARPSVVRVPASVLIFRKEGVLVATVGEDSRVVMKPVVIAEDLGTAVDIGSGLSASDSVVDNPSEGLENGDQVQVLAPKDSKGKSGNVPA